MVSKLMGLPIQRNKAIVGTNAFAHSSGIHQDGIIKDRSTYEIIRPEDVGVTAHTFALTARSGRAALKHHISGMGHHLTDAQLAEIYETFLVLADKKKEVMVEDLEILVQDTLFKVPETYKLVNLQILSGTKATPMAALKVQRNNEVIEEAATGNGPIDAAYKCIERIVGANFKLIDFGLNAVTSGQDAIGEARVRIRSNGTIFSGGASSTDIIEAAIKAYLSAINRWVAAEAKTKPGKKGAAKKAPRWPRSRSLNGTPPGGARRRPAPPLPRDPPSPRAGTPPGTKYISFPDSTRVSPSIVNSIVPDTIIPICSCGWECVGTTAFGARVTRENIIFSPEAIFAVTPGASILGGISFRVPETVHVDLLSG